MVPRNAARNAPSVILLAEILQRAGLRLGVVSLACCVLDCLSDWFIRHWKLECCKIGEGFPERGEILAIAALAISMKFLEDAVCRPVWPILIFGANCHCRCFCRAIQIRFGQTTSVRICFRSVR
jgi:hypothetical protein